MLEVIIFVIVMLFVVLMNVVSILTKKAAPTKTNAADAASSIVNSVDIFK